MSDDGDDELTPPVIPPHPDDRLWRHPSEMALIGPSGAAPVRAGGSRKLPRLWTVAVCSALLGAVLSVGVLAATLGVGSDPSSPGGVAIAKASLVTGGATKVVAELSQSLAHVHAGDPAGPGGSALVFRSDGYLLTARHVVDGRTEVTVTLADGTEVVATLVGSDESTDVAVLRVPRTGLHAPLLNGDKPMQVGQPTAAVGAPDTALGSATVVLGVISGLDRKMNLGKAVLHGMLETDARVRTEALGGALCDTEGRVVGLLTAPASATEGAYATPMEVVRTVAEDIVATGRARHVWLGVEGKDLAAARAATLEIPGGAEISRVVADSPASVAGLRDGDIITEIDTVPITTMSTLVVFLRHRSAGEMVTIDYLRGAERFTCRARLVAR